MVRVLVEANADVNAADNVRSLAPRAASRRVPPPPPLLARSSCAPG